MFPQLIAGPIVRYHDVNVQLAVRKHSFAQFSEASALSVRSQQKGTAVQCVRADCGRRIQICTERAVCRRCVDGRDRLHAADYFDFSGYSDMAVGLGRMLGFEFMRNFNYPYIAKSVTEFWRRCTSPSAPGSGSTCISPWEATG